MRESRYQALLIRTLKEEFPECVVIKNDPNYIQGIPDLLVLYCDMWAMLEVKAHATASSRPNQGYYVELLNEMSFAAVIYPENEQEVLDALRITFQSRRNTRRVRRQ